MLFGVSGAGLPAGLQFGVPIEAAAVAAEFPPCWLYAHGWQETIKVAGWIGTLGKTPATFISDDGGHGIFQLTASYPPNWQDPQANATYAIQNFLKPAIAYWNQTHGLTGDALIKCVAAQYNAGAGGAQAGYAEGDVGKYTTHTNGVSYSDLVLKYFRQLAAGQAPSG
jgi:hypothetical protein